MPIRSPLRSRLLRALLASAAVGAAAGLYVLRGEGGAAAQEPLPTLVITQPTPTATPAPSYAEAGLGQSASALYVVQPGDTLLSVALELGLDVDDMGCVLRPDFDSSQPLVIGDALAPLPAGIGCVRAQAGESLRVLAEAQGVAPDAIVADPWNGLSPLTAGSLDASLAAGRYVRVPRASLQVQQPMILVGQSGGASPFLTWMLAQPANTPPLNLVARTTPPAAAGPVPVDWPYGSGRFEWPAYGLLTQGYRSDHRAIDIAAPAGSPVTASDRGVVLRAGWNHQGYGQFVIIDHNIDYISLYAHLDTIFVRPGDIVAQGQLIGTMGATGNATGPHLHFEIRDFGRLANPIEYLAR